MRKGSEKHLPLGAFLNAARNHVRVSAENVRKQQLVAVPVGFQRLIQRNLHACAAVAAQEHQHFVLNAAAGVGGELDFLRRVESVDGFNQPDRADGNEILQHDAGVVELPGDKDDEAEIVFNQRRADGSAVGVEPGKERLFLCRCQRAGMGSGPPM